METKLDKIQEDIVEIKETLARNTTSLELHIHRTEVAEETLKIISNTQNDLELKLISHINQVKGAGIAIGVIGSVILALWQMGILAKLL